MIESVARPRLELLECARGLAAFAVVLFHANATSRIEGWRSYEWFTVFQYGVDFFFVLSGFIIYHAHARDFGRAGQLAPYLIKRAIRLLPMLWLVTGLTFGLQFLLGMTVDFSQFLRSAIPYPSLLPTDPAVVWTLRHEFLFYATIALTIASKRLGYAAMAVWVFATLAQLGALAMGRGATGLASFFVASYSLDFFFGMAVAAAHARRGPAPRRWPLAAGLLLLVIAFAWDATNSSHRFGPSDYVSPQAAWFTLVLGLIFALIVHGLVSLEGRLKAPRALVVLGGATYSLYLIHAPLNGLAMKLLRPYDAPLGSGAGAVLLVALGAGAGIALHHLFEKPIGRALKDRFVPRTARPQAATEPIAAPAPINTLR